jgi:hypothetical protein
MSRTITLHTKPVAQFSGPPADRMAGRSTRAVAPRGGEFTQAARKEVSAETASRANSFLSREALLDEAVHQGVIGHALRAHYAQCYDADPTGTRTYLQNIGLRLSTATAPAAATTSEEYDDSALSNAERGRIAAAREGRQPRFITGGL